MGMDGFLASGIKFTENKTNVLLNGGPALKIVGATQDRIMKTEKKDKESDLGWVGSCEVY